VPAARARAENLREPLAAGEAKGAEESRRARHEGTKKNERRQEPACTLQRTATQGARTVETMLACVASSLARRTGIPRNNIFINHRQARSGMVFDAGSVEHW
jgi:hypothetical protein